jgi:Protein of unknown function (DUF3631)
VAGSYQLPSINKVAEVLGGNVANGEAIVPGPGHSAEDRSLAVKLNGAAPDGFVVHSFAGDDPIACRDYVRQKLRLPEFEPKKKANGGGRPFSPTVAKYIYRLTDDTPYLQVHRLADKSSFPQYHWDGEKWISGKPKGPKVPYMLPQLIEAAATTPVYICEGEKDVNNLVKIGFVATCNSEGADNGNGNKWTSDLNQYFKDRHVYIIPDNDALGRKHAQHVARNLHPIAKSVRIVELPGLPFKGDVSNWLESDSAGVRLAKLAAAASLWEPSADSDEELIAELAALSKLQYAKRRKDAAETIGINVGELDKIVAAARGECKDEKRVPALYEHWNVEAANEPVDGGILLRALKEAIQHYVFMSDDQAVAVALWIVFSWLHEHEGAVTHSPILYVTSAEKDSGKSTLLGVVNFLARRGLQSVDIRGPALFRSITKWQPTFIVDEADDALANNPDLRSVINSGWTRGQGVIRCHPDTHQPELFSTFAPKVIAMKGRNVPDTTLSRSIVITMKPRRPDDPKEHAADFNHCDTETFARLRSQLMRWATDKAAVLAKAVPEIPPGFHNRRRANWVPLLAIAEAAGGDWKKAGWKAALALEAVADTFDPSVGIELLRAIKGAFEARETDRITSAGLISDLVADETAPWATYNKGRSISQRQVASLLKPYEIKPKTIRLDDGGTAKGFMLAWFTDAFGRFCSPYSAKTRGSIRHAVTDLFSQEFSPFSSVTDPIDETDKNDEKHFNNNDVTNVTDQSTQWAREGGREVHGVTAENESNSLKASIYHALTDANPDAVAARRYEGAGAFRDRTCAQCRGLVDGRERQVAMGLEGTVWLHPECERFYLEAQTLPW